MKRLLTAVLIALSVTLGLRLNGDISANHFIYLPYAPNTWLMQKVITAQEYTYCLDSRAETWPNFAAQLRDVNDQYAERVGIRYRQVAFNDASCQVQHVMLPDFPCGSGAAACIYYMNSPVVVHYQENLGYSDWRSAQGHELGHGLLGLHEQYQDSGGSIQCLYRPETVMSCGEPFTRYPQQLDVDRGCAIIATPWCGNPPTPPLEEWQLPCEPYGGCWNNFDQVWRWNIERLMTWQWDGSRWFCIWNCP